MNRKKFVAEKAALLGYTFNKCFNGGFECWKKKTGERIDGRNIDDIERKINFLLIQEDKNVSCETLRGENK